MAPENAAAADAGTPQNVPDPLGLGPVVHEPGRPTMPWPDGTRRMSAAGYIVVKCRDGTWESEGRLVLERHLGRELAANESARHKAGRPRWDNRLEALELWRDGRPVRFNRTPTKRRTNWKGLYQEAIAVLADVFEDRALQNQLDDDQAAAVQRALGNRPPR